MAEVEERLRARFPELDPTVVEAAVRVAGSEITGPVRDFVPLLAERAARERLQRLVASEDAAGVADVEDAADAAGVADAADLPLGP